MSPTQPESGHFVAHWFDTFRCPQANFLGEPHQSAPAASTQIGRPNRWTHPKSLDPPFPPHHPPQKRCLAGTWKSLRAPQETHFSAPTRLGTGLPVVGPKSTGKRGFNNETSAICPSHSNASESSTDDANAFIHVHHQPVHRSNRFPSQIPPKPRF